MKEINLKDACKAGRELESKMRELDFKTGVSYYSEQDLANARESKDKAAEEFNAICDHLLLDTLNQVQRRCITRTVSAQMIVAKLMSIEDKLDIPKARMDGITVAFDLNARTFPNAYKWTPESTIVYARYKSGCWRVTDICRDRTFRETQATRVILTEDAKDAIIARFSIMS